MNFSARGKEVAGQAAYQNAVFNAEVGHSR